MKGYLASGISWDSKHARYPYPVFEAASFGFITNCPNITLGQRWTEIDAVNKLLEVELNIDAVFRDISSIFLSHSE